MKNRVISRTAGIGIIVILSVGIVLAITKPFSVMEENDIVGGFQFPSLPYGYDALEPYIDAKTMEIHYDRHHRAYFNNFVNAIKGTPVEDMSLEEIFAQMSSMSDVIRNNGGGFYNHNLFWKNMSPNGGEPSDELTAAIEKAFGSFDNFKELFGSAAASRFGSGWAWLVVNSEGELEVGSTPNQDNPLMDISPIRGIPILGLDVWEHAYYLKYQNRRPDYIDNFWNIVNWRDVSERYEAALK